MPIVPFSPVDAPGTMAVPDSVFLAMATATVNAQGRLFKTEEKPNGPSPSDRS